MSDILIRGMKLPKDGEHPIELSIFSDGTVVYNLNDGLGWKRGQAIELPEHGRLIDADALVKNAVDFYDPYGIINGVTLDEIDDAPTIIPASKKEDDE